jgi:hypothetical protein
MVVDVADFPVCCRAALTRIAAGRIIVVGPEPDPSYQEVALAHGAAAWIPRDRVGDDLAAEMRRVLGWVHDPCPPGAHEDSAPADVRTEPLAPPSDPGVQSSRSWNP